MRLSTLALAALASAALAARSAPPDHRRIVFDGGVVVLDETTLHQDGTLKKVRCTVNVPGRYFEMRRKRRDREGVVSYRAASGQGRVVAKWEDGALVKATLRTRGRDGNGFRKRIRLRLEDVKSWDIRPAD